MLPCLTVIPEIPPCPFSCLQVPCKTNPSYFPFSHRKNKHSKANLSLSPSPSHSLSHDMTCLTQYGIQYELSGVVPFPRMSCLSCVLHVKTPRFANAQHGSITNQFGYCLPLMLLLFVCFRDLGRSCPHLCTEVFP